MEWKKTDGGICQRLSVYLFKATMHCHFQALVGRETTPSSNPWEHLNIACVLQGHGGMKSATLCVNGLSDSQVTGHCCHFERKKTPSQPTDRSHNRSTYVALFPHVFSWTIPAACPLSSNSLRRRKYSLCGVKNTDIGMATFTIACVSARIYVWVRTVSVELNITSASMNALFIKQSVWHF